MESKTGENAGPKSLSSSNCSSVTPAKFRGGSDGIDGFLQANCVHAVCFAKDLEFHDA
jgi:hypothetical protein